MGKRSTASLTMFLAIVFFVSLVYAASTEVPKIPAGVPGAQGQQLEKHGAGSIPTGAVVTVRTDSQISVGTAKPGDIFQATLHDDIVDQGKVLVRRGTPAEIRLTKVREDRDELAFKLYSISIEGKKVRVVSDTAREVARQEAPKQQPGLGGALGQAGAAALGSAMGAKPGTLTWTGAPAPDAVVPAGTFMEFTLREQVNLGR